LTSPWWHWDQDALVLNVHVQTRASCNEIVGVQGERLKVRVACAPTGGKANRKLIALLARAFRVSPSAVSLRAGEHARNKRLAVHAPRVFPRWLPVCREASVGLPDLQRGRARPRKPDVPPFSAGRRVHVGRR
jgi:uncharacterized protein (TIGR00251 family)